MNNNLCSKDLDGEIWKDILDYNGDYQVSNIGRVKSFKKCRRINERILKQCIDGHGYFIVGLFKNKKSKSKRVHRLMFETFIGKIPEGYIVHHIDENKENNDLENFRLMTEEEHQSFHMKGKNHPMFGKKHSEETRKKMSENHVGMFGKHRYGKDAPMFGKKHSEETRKKMSESRKGENAPNLKLSNKDVKDIRKSLELKLYTPKQLSWMFDVNIQTISKIKNNKIWKI